MNKHKNVAAGYENTKTHVGKKLTAAKAVYMCLFAIFHVFLLLFTFLSDETKKLEIIEQVVGEM